MSLLVCSLLAFAALFATAATLPPPRPPPNCTEKTFGQTTPYPVPLLPVTVPSPGGTVDIIDYCPTGFHRDGETVLACNNDPNGLPPLVYLTNPPDLEYVKVDCLDSCPWGVTVTVTEYCAHDFSEKDSSSRVVPLAQKSRSN